MNVEIGAEAALFPEKEYIMGIFVAVLSAIHQFDKQSSSVLILLESVLKETHTHDSSSKLAPPPAISSAILSKQILTKGSEAWFFFNNLFQYIL